MQIKRNARATTDLKQDAGACRVGLPAVEQPVLLGLQRRKQAEDFLHHPEALVVIDNGKRRLGVAGVALLDRGAQFGELVADELAQPDDRLTLPRIAAHQIGHPVERYRKLLYGCRIRFEIAVAASQQIPALAGLGALHQVEHAVELFAHRHRMLHPQVVALVARVEPEGGRHDHGRQRRGNEEAPIEQSERFRAGQRGAHDACDFAGALASADGQFPVRTIDITGLK